jgi:hypothetical protein
MSIRNYLPLASRKVRATCTQSTRFLLRKSRKRPNGNIEGHQRGGGGKTKPANQFTSKWVLEWAGSIPKILNKMRSSNAEPCLCFYFPYLETNGWGASGVGILSGQYHFATAGSRKWGGQGISIINFSWNFFFSRNIEKELLEKKKPNRIE